MESGFPPPCPPLPPSSAFPIFPPHRHSHNRGMYYAHGRIPRLSAIPAVWGYGGRHHPATRAHRHHHPPAPPRHRHPPAAQHTGRTGEPPIRHQAVPAHRAPVTATSHGPSRPAASPADRHHRPITTRLPNHQRPPSTRQRPDHALPRRKRPCAAFHRATPPTTRPDGSPRS